MASVVTGRILGRLRQNTAAIVAAVIEAAAQSSTKVEAASVCWPNGHTPFRMRNWRPNRAPMGAGFGRRRKE